MPGQPHNQADYHTEKQKEPSGEKVKALTGFWHNARRWFLASAFEPAWLPRSLRHPAIGYLVAVALQIIMAALDMLVFLRYPVLPHHLPFILIVVVVALYWGVGPSIAATFIGGFLLYYVVFPPHFTWNLDSEQDIAGLALYLCTSLIVSILASQKEQARRKAERLMREAEQARQDAQRLERRTHQAFNALLAMAEALVQPFDEQVAPEKGTGRAVNLAARRLAELTSNVLECPNVSLSALDLEKGISHPLAVCGLSPEEEQQWWAGQRRSERWASGAYPEATARLQAGETRVLDASEPLLSHDPNPYQAQLLLAVPMRVGERLIGLLIADPRSATRRYTDEELALAEAVAKLGALLIERERLLIEREEARANELALREATRQMDTFLGMASHELKTPLTTIKLNLQLTQRRLEKVLCEDAGTVEQRQKKAMHLLEQLTHTDRQADRLDRLVNDLLDVSRIQANRLDLRLEPVDLAAIVREVVEEQRQAVTARPITLHLPMNTRVPAFVDGDRIGQVVTNYLTNALKYSAEERSVEVGLSVEGDQARIWVRDQGPGIPAGEQEHVWERFHRVPGIEVQSGSGIGLGLGLHISRTIIERHHGQVGLESTPGVGSTFWCTLPLAP
jgi:signal transduction histidine kinase